MIRVNILIISIFLLITTSISLACYFDTGWTTFTQPNGNKFIARMYGDEYESRFETQEGFSLEKNFKDGYYYYASSSNNGRFELTGQKVGIDQPFGIPKSLVKINPFKSRSNTNNTNNNLIKNKILAKTETTTTYTIKVFLIEFQDVHGRSKYTRTNFTNMLAGSNYIQSPDNNETTYGSVNQYYQSMSNSKIAIQATVLNNSNGGDIPIWIRLPHNKSDYYNNLYDIYTDASNACAGFDTTTDATHKIAFIYAGCYYGGGLNPSTSNWGNQYLMYEYWDGQHYQEGDISAGYTFAHIGTHCHEFGHTLGMVDIYQGQKNINWSLYGNGDKLGPLAYLKQSKGQCPAPIDPVQRSFFNWITIQTPAYPYSSVVLNYNGSNPTVYRIIKDGSFYYCFEYRRYLDYNQFCPGYNTYGTSGGILVWKGFGSTISLIAADNSQDPLGTYGNLWPGSSGNRNLNDFTTPNCSLTSGIMNSSIIMHFVGDPGTTSISAYIADKWSGNLPSSLTWSGDSINVGGNVTIPAGLNLTINNNLKQVFQNSSSLIVNGSLTANGNSSSTPILFNFTTPNSSLNNGIVFNIGSSGTINYCQIRNADRGIYENGVSVNISNSAFSGCNSGIYLYSSSPTILSSNIHNNTNYGIYLTSSSPILENNYIQSNGIGVNCSTSSNPKFGNGSTQGKNNITSNTTGVFCQNNSYPIIGNSSPLNGGYNDLTNTTSNVYNMSSGTVYAMYNWWGTTVPGNFKITGTGSVVYTSYQTSSITIPQPPLSKSSANILLASDVNAVPMLDQLNQINELIAGNNLVGARNICMNLITNYPDYSVSYNALNLLKDTYANDSSSSKNSYISLFKSSGKKNIYAMAGLILSDLDKENKLSRINDAEPVNTNETKILCS